MELKGIKKYKRKETMVFKFKQGVIKSKSITELIEKAKAKGWKREDITERDIWEEV